MRLMPIKPKLLEDSKESIEFLNHSRIISLPADESKVRGFSNVDLIIIDEAARVPNELYHSVTPMLAVSDGRLILLSTPYGKRGFFFEEWANGGEKWERVMVTAMNCPRLITETLDEEIIRKPDWLFRQEFLCEFVQTEAQYFDPEEIKQAVTSDCRPLFST